VEVLLDGNSISTEMDVHRALSDALDFGSYYGFNLAALWDRLSTDVERPIVVRWVNSVESRKRLGSEFDEIVDLLHRVEAQDVTFGWDDRFEFVLE